MTESEWLAATDMKMMVRFLRPNASYRKLRLFACGCCRGQSRLLDKWSRKTLAAAERYADGKISEGQLRAVLGGEQAAVQNVVRREGYSASAYAMWAVSELCQPAIDELLAAAHLAAMCETYPPNSTPLPLALQRQISLLQDIFGNPFRPVTVEPVWLTSTVLALARQIYDSRDFTAMPVLADALQDAGCNSEDVLSHCRDPHQVHVRGCWVVDLVIGRK